MAAVSRQFSIKSILQAGRAAFLSFLAKKVAYLPAQVGNEEHAKLANARLIILSRACYRESVASYPIAATTELKKILKQQHQEPGCYHFIGNLQDGIRQVLTISVFAQYSALCQQAFFVVPASLLANYATTGRFKQVTANDCQFFMQPQPDGLWQSVLQSQLIANVDRAKLALGVPADAALETYTLPAPKQLAASLVKIPLRFWASCAVKQQALLPQLNFKPLLLASAIIGAAYLALSSLYLHFTLNSRQQAFTHLLSETQAISTDRRQLEQDVALLTFLAEQRSNPLPVLAFWSVYASWQLQDVQLVSVRSDFNDITVQGEAASATTVLQQTLDLPYVADARFTAPVRRGQRGREQFTLVLTLQPDALSELRHHTSSAEPALLTTEGETP